MHWNHCWRTPKLPHVRLHRQLAGVLALATLSPAVLHAEVRLPSLLSDHGVLQRDAPIRIWGWADPGEPVTVSFHAQKLSTTADQFGKWNVALLSEQAGGPYTLTVQGKNTITLSDMLVGDVWFASGQSNMEFPLLGFGPDTPMNDSAKEIAAANHPEIRLIHYKNHASDYAEADAQTVDGANWTLCTPETAAHFSAVAYFFGRELNQREHVPIGLIDSSWGGTPAAAWISLDGLSSDAALMPAFAARVPMVDSQQDVPAMAAEEKREDAAALAAGQPKPKHPWHPDPSSYAPAGLYNGMVAPAVNYSIKGVIWYQGETDSGESRASLYEKLFPAMITDWRSHWHEGNFPFLFVQISSFTSVPAETWGIVREAQRRTLKLDNTAMAVTLDIGNPGNVHPADKQDVGARLALAARAMVYGEKIEYSGPIFHEANTEGASMRVWFDHAAGLSTNGGTTEVGGFDLAGSDHHFHPATAKIEGATVLVTAPGVDHPQYVRYAWTNAPTTANLINSAGLPASTFISTDHIPPPATPQP